MNIAIFGNGSKMVLIKQPVDYVLGCCWVQVFVKDGFHSNDCQPKLGVSDWVE
jgi:hypothetical protein